VLNERVLLTAPKVTRQPWSSDLSGQLLSRVRAEIAGGLGWQILRVC